MRRYLQFRLRTLFVFTTLAAVGCAVGQPVVSKYLAYREEQRRKQALLRVFL